MRACSGHSSASLQFPALRAPPTSPSCTRLAVQRSPEGLPAQGCQVTPLYLLRGPLRTPPALPAPRPRLALLNPVPGLLDLRVPGPGASSCWEASSGLGSAPCATCCACQGGCCVGVGGARLLLGDGTGSGFLRSGCLHAGLLAGEACWPCEERIGA